MISTDVERLQQVLNEALLAEWEAQGHSMTGKVVKDIEYVVRQEVDKLTISGMMYPYASILAAGTKAGKIPFSGRGGGGTSLYIQALKNYVKNRMSVENDKKALSIAFAIAHTQKKEGMPTKGSYQYSSTGKRTEWIGDALKNSESKISESISAMAFNLLTVKIDVLIDRWNIELNKN